MDARTGTELLFRARAVMRDDGVVSEALEEVIRVQAAYLYGELAAAASLGPVLETRSSRKRAWLAFVSGDGIFATSAAQLQEQDVTVLVVSRASAV